jgi:ribosomal protein S6--L-glutamate ligase
MNICLIIDKQETLYHPTIGVALQKLSEKHTIRFLNVQTLTGEEAIAQEQAHPQADLYLLKSHASQALEVAYSLEQQGALVVNSWASSVACQDRVLLSQRLDMAHLPHPQSQYFPSLEHLLAQAGVISTLTFPLMIKSRYSYRGDLVKKIASLQELQALAAHWSEEPIILQEFIANGGWDIKFWVINQRLFAARRPTPLLSSTATEDVPLSVEELPQDWIDMIAMIGRVFDLHLYGVDLLVSECGPSIIDVNAFPGFRGAAGAADALVFSILISLSSNGSRNDKVPASPGEGVYRQNPQRSSENA